MVGKFRQLFSDTSICLTACLVSIAMPVGSLIAWSCVFWTGCNPVNGWFPTAAALGFNVVFYGALCLHLIPGMDSSQYDPDSSDWRGC